MFCVTVYLRHSDITENPLYKKARFVDIDKSTTVECLHVEKKNYNNMKWFIVL